MSQSLAVFTSSVDVCVPMLRVDVDVDATTEVESVTGLVVSLSGQLLLLISLFLLMVVFLFVNDVASKRPLET